MVINLSWKHCTKISPNPTDILLYYVLKQYGKDALNNLLRKLL